MEYAISHWLLAIKDAVLTIHDINLKNTIKANKYEYFFFENIEFLLHILHKFYILNKKSLTRQNLLNLYNSVFRGNYYTYLLYV